MRQYFSDAPILIEIARCESNFRHHTNNGEVLRGYANRSDIGVMQINKYYHGDKAKALGVDIFSRDGNMEYARYLYEKEGVTPWNASRSCWGHKVFELALNR